MLRDLIEKNTKNSYISKICYVGPELNANKFFAKNSNLKEFKKYTTYNPISLLKQKPEFDVVILDLSKGDPENLFSTIFASCRLSRLNGFFIILTTDLSNFKTYVPTFLELFFSKVYLGNVFDLVDKQDSNFIFRRIM
jgi:hypothetical protein